jgi:hypothetical protein
MVAAAIRMQSSQERQEYEADKKALRDARVYVGENLQALQRISEDRKTVNRTRQITMDAARRLARIKHAEAYREEFGTRGWEEFCRSIKYSSNTVSRLLNLVRVTDSLSPEAQKKLGQDGMSMRQAVEIGRMPEDDREAIINQAAAEGDTSPAKLGELREQNEQRQLDAEDSDFAKLRETLKAAAPSTRNKLDEGEAAKKSKTPEHALSWAKRQATTWQTWFDVRGRGDEAKVLIDQLLALAQECA